jgi:hypothetical protein
MPTTPDLLAEALEAQAPAHKGPRCGVCEWLDTLTDDWRSQVEAMMTHDSPRIHAKVILATMERHGLPCVDAKGKPVAVGTVNRHRKPGHGAR